MKTLNYLSPHDEAFIADAEQLCRCKGPAAQVTDDLRQAFGREVGYGYGCGGPPYESRILLRVSPRCALDLASLVETVSQFHYHFYFTHCYVLQGDAAMPDNTIDVTVYGRCMEGRETLLAAAAEGSYNAVVALGCDTAWPLGWYSPYVSGRQYSLTHHMALLLMYAPVCTSPLRALAQACRVGLMVDRDERLAGIFERCAEEAEARYTIEELQEYADNFNDYEAPQYIFFSPTDTDRQYVFDWLERMANDWDSPFHELASEMVCAYTLNGLLDDLGIRHLDAADAPF